MSASDLLPEFMHRLARDDIKTVFLTGCGGGFDFVHSMTILPELMRLGKKVVIGSYSFGDPWRIQGGDVVFERPLPFQAIPLIVKKVDATCRASRAYGPEVGLCAYLDERYPANKPHSVYAYYARSFTVPLLTALYEQLFNEHGVDAVVSFDGGSDSLMRGDEEAGLGDPIEDAVTVATLATMTGVPSLKERILISIGLGCDVYDDATGRAVAELSVRDESTGVSGCLGCAQLYSGHPMHTFYAECVRFLQDRAEFRSVIANSIVAVTDGNNGAQELPAELAGRVKLGKLYCWPLMSTQWEWGFSIEHVFQRSLLCERLLPCTTFDAMYTVLEQLRDELAKENRLVAEAPPLPKASSSASQRRHERENL